MATTKILIARKRSKTTLQIKTRLSRLGYKVTGTAATIPSIFKNIERKNPDLVLLDLGIKDGDHVVKLAREIQSSFNIPVILLDGRTQAISHSPASLPNSFDCVRRPFRSEELHTAIEMALYKHSLKKQGVDPDQLAGKDLPEQPIRKSEKLFSKVFHASPSGMIISSLEDGAILDANRSYERLLGYSSEDLKGNNGLDLRIYNDPAERQQIVELLQRDGFVHGDPQSQRVIPKNALL